MESILPTNEYKEVDGRAYLNPEIALNEANQFIDNLRATQGRQNQEIAKQTYDLGTSLPSVQGGLGTNTANNMAYFTSRYQTPQTASIVGDLRATAQAAALNQVLANEQAMWQKKYNDAYRSYQKRSGGGSGGGSGGSGGNGGDDGNSSTWDGQTEKEVVGPTKFYGVPNANVEKVDGGWVYTDPDTGEKVTVSEEYINKIFDENGNITPDGQVILDTRRMLGL